MEVTMSAFRTKYKCIQEDNGVAIYNNGERLGSIFDEEIPTAESHVDLDDAMDEFFNRVEVWLVDNN